MLDFIDSSLLLLLTLETRLKEPFHLYAGPMHDYSALLQAAQSARCRSYSPYSKFAVGAAILGRSGKVYLGANVENASFGLCICAERVAAVQAIMAGEEHFQVIACVSDSYAQRSDFVLFPFLVIRTVVHVALVDNF